MRCNRDKWQFYNSVSYPPVSQHEMRYWKNMLSKILKVGIEYEFNLQEVKATCKGSSPNCMCIHIGEGCWKTCLHEKECQQTPNIETCTNRRAKCTPDACKNCKQYSFRCLETLCSHFISKCFMCADFDLGCSQCKKYYNHLHHPKEVRKRLSAELEPTGTYGKVGKFGVVDLTSDGSLLGDRGVEIVTVGRRVDYWEFYNMSKVILDKVSSLGGYFNERTGAHMHVLSSHYDSENSNELEKPMPQIILANLHQLVRRYQNALTWITSALNDPNAITRWEKFRYGVLDFSPLGATMVEVSDKIGQSAGRNKYGFINYQSTRFDPNNDVSVFHVEFREADAALSPSYFAAIACLHYAFVIKAVEISKYGLLKVGDKNWLTKARQLKEIILNGNGDYGSNRVSYTPEVLTHRNDFIEEASDMISHMKGILLPMGPAYEILMKLAVEPISMRRIAGERWEKIEEDLAVELPNVSQLEIAIDEVIDLTLIDDCVNMEDWFNAVYQYIKTEQAIADVTKDKVKTYVINKIKEGEMIWSDAIGCIVNVY